MGFSEAKVDLKFMLLKSSMRWTGLQEVGTLVYLFEVHVAMMHPYQAAGIDTTRARLPLKPD